MHYERSSQEQRHPLDVFKKSRLLKVVYIYNVWFELVHLLYTHNEMSDKYQYFIIPRPPHPKEASLHS